MKFDLNEKQSRIKKDLREHLGSIEEKEFMQGYYRNVFKEQAGAILIDIENDAVSKITALIEVAKSSPSLSLALLDTAAGNQVFKQGAGEVRHLSFAFTEKRAGSDLSRIETKAELQEGGWMLEGEKKYVLCSELTEELIILAKLNDSSYGLFQVPASDENISHTKEEIMGADGLCHTTISLEKVSVSSSRLLSKVDKEFSELQPALHLNTLYMAAVATGIAERAMSEALDYARTREQFGSVIGEYQAIQFKIAEAVVRINASKTLLYEAAQKLDRKEGAAAEIAMSKVYASETAKIAVNHALQIFGSAAIGSSSTIAKLYQIQRLTEIYGQTSELLRVEIAADLIASYSDELVSTH